MPRVKGDTYFNNFEQSGYDELRGWTPSYYQGIKEADANLRFAGDTVDMMAKSLEDFCLNMFIDTMGPEAITRMEAFYKIVKDETIPLEERRRKVNLARNGGHKLSGSLLRTMVTQYTGCEDPKISFDNLLRIMAMLEDDFTADTKELVAQIQKMLPAHILVELKEGVRLFCDLLSVHSFMTQQMGIVTSVKFYEYDALDGGFLLDGSKNLDSEIGRFSPYILISFRGVQTEVIADTAVTLSVASLTEEKVELGDSIGISTSIDEFSQCRTEISMIQSFEAVTKEEISASLETQKKMWHLDGTETLGSGRTLDAYEEKEDL